MHFFVTDRRFQAVAGINDRVIRQREELGADGSNKLFMTGERKVRSADGL